MNPSAVSRTPVRTPEGRFSNVRWILIFWMFAVSAIAYIDRVNISIAGHAIATEFHLSNVELGWVFSAFVLGYAAFQAPGGWLADRFGPRSALTFGVVWWGVFTSLITFVSADIAGLIVILIAIRLSLGIGEAIVYPASNCVVAAWIPSSERGIANGVIFAGVGFGAGITPPIITYFLLHHGWRSSFWASAVLGLAAGAIWYLIARDDPKEHPWIGARELAHIQGEKHLSAASGHEDKRLSWGAILGNRNLIAVTFSYFCYGYVAYIFFSWFFIYLNTVRGLDLKQSSYYTMLPFLAMAAGSPLGGWLSDRITRSRGPRAGRCVFSAVSIGLSAIFVALGTQVASAQMASLVLAGGAGALYLSQSCFWSVSADIGKRSAGSVSGVMNMGCQIGGALTASLTPVIANRLGWTASFLVAAALSAAGAVAWLLVNPDRERAS
ncbi:MAG TPA: MFS transporter [Bryobacteraceae bacterium]|nr:MFS transporter [Bryobacteraceae bacterium]